MDFYHVLFAKRYGFNGKLTWYGNLFAKAIGGALSKIAKFISIKGNTLVWNQLVQNGNFTDTSNWATEYTTFTVSNNVASVVGTRNGNNYIRQNYQGGGIGHKYYFRCDYYTVDAQTEPFIVIYTGSTTRRTIFTPTEYGKWLTYEAIIDNDATDTTQYQIRLQSRKQDVTNQFRNCMVVDLTKMGLDITDPSEFTSLFSLPYYDYNAGTPLSFNGTGIKTTGKNLCNIVATGGISSSTGADVSNNARIKSDYLRVIANQPYTISTSGINTGVILYDMNKNFTSSLSGPTFTPTIDGFIRLVFRKQDNTDFSSLDEITCQLEFGSTSSDYEPYTTSTTTLPISTYFPWGMDGVGTAYDELTSTGYVKRIGQVDLGSLTYTYNNTSYDYGFFTSNSIANRMIGSTNLMCAKYETKDSRSTLTDKSMSTYNNSTSRQIAIRDDSFTDPDLLKASLSGVYLYYELATPIENYGIVDLGTLDWSSTMTTVSGKYRWLATVNGIKLAEAQTSIGNILTNKYKTITYNDSFNTTKGDGIAVSSTDERIAIYDESLATSTAQSVKSSLSGVYLLYELATPLENYGVVDLGSMNWTYSSANSVFLGGIVGKTYPAGSPSNVLCPLYTTKNVSNGNGAYPGDDMIVWKLTTGAIRIKNSAYTEPSAFKQAMQGVYLLYEKQTSETSDLTYTVYKGGTEQLLPENGSVPTTAPILADIKYPDGLRTDQMFTYRAYESSANLTNNALSIIMGRNVSSEEAKTALDIITKGE